MNEKINAGELLLRNSLATTSEFEKLIYETNKLLSYIDENTTELSKIYNNDDYNIKLVKIRLIKNSLKDEHQKIINVQHLLEETNSLNNQLDDCIVNVELHSPFPLNLAKQTLDNIKVFLNTNTNKC